MNDTAAHVEKETLSVDVNIPEHAARVTTALFTRTRKLLIEREGGRCWICRRTEAEAGKPLESHHFIIERCFAEAVDWPRFIEQAKLGDYGLHAQSFDWDHFDPKRPYDFVDDQTANGRVLCDQCHRGRDRGIHAIPYPLHLAQRFLKDGYSFSDFEVIHYGE